MSSPRPQRAAGGVAFRPVPGTAKAGGTAKTGGTAKAGGTAKIGRSAKTGGIEVALVHRPRFDDWSLPKGKVKRNERALVGAVREVFEETGIRAVAGARLPTVSYDIWSGDELVDKVVDYWAMAAAELTAFSPGTEVDEVAWLPLRAAVDRATYPHDKRVLRAFGELPTYAPPVLLLRHASAGERDQWRGPDDKRPLDDHGTQDAEALAPVLACFGPTTLISAEPLRCQQTLAPLGDTIHVDAAFNESADPAAAARRIRELAASGVVAVVCTQGALIPKLLAHLSGQAPGRYHTDKGEGWVLSFAGDRLALVDELPLHGR